MGGQHMMDKCGMVGGVLMVRVLAYNDQMRGGATNDELLECFLRPGVGRGVCVGVCGCVWGTREVVVVYMGVASGMQGREERGGGY